MPDITLAEKSYLATIILAAALAQAASISIARGWTVDASIKLRRYAFWAHRMGGYIGLVLILTISYYCIYKIDPITQSVRPEVHALLGITAVILVIAKVLTARFWRRQYGKLPVIGGLLVAVLAAAWATSALWYFITF